MEDKLSSFTVGVVPEHFSLPWQLAKGKGIFKKYNVEVTTVEHPRGTGSMCRSLRNGELDIAVALTEGVIADIVTAGPGIKILATYVQSPLHWAVVVDPLSSFQKIDELQGTTFGISRFGSGSHLMTFLMGNERHWNMEKDIKFEPKGGLMDLLGGIKDHTIDSFLWETFTTKPYMDQGLVRKIGEVVTPWPCFVIAARAELMKTHKESLLRLLAAIQEACVEFKKTEKSLKYISKESKLSLEDSKTWFDQVEFSNGKVSKKVLQDAVQTLTKTGVLKANVDILQLCEDSITSMID